MLIAIRAAAEPEPAPETPDSAAAPPLSARRRALKRQLWEPADRCGPDVACEAWLKGW